MDLYIKSEEDLLTNNHQLSVWEEEHRNPRLLTQLDSEFPSGGVVNFFNWLKDQDIKGTIKGLEIGCGKGRNVNWLAKQNVIMTGIDFSQIAITKAKKRASEVKVENNTKFILADITNDWSFKNSEFDFTIDCFTTVEIVSIQEREKIAKEVFRTLKPGRFHLVYALSTDDEFYKKMSKHHSSKERHTISYPSNGKIEKYFDRDELINLFGKLELILEKRIEKKVFYYDQAFHAKHFWMVFKKP
jgi:SAM-dependent methyltransferase